MEFNKNSELLQRICLAQIKSVDATVSIPEFLQIFSTPSKITFRNRTSLSPSGVMHTKQLSLFYPGLSDQDFNKFHELVKGNYQVLVKLNNNAIYEIASLQIPMECNTSFTLGDGHALTFESTSPIAVKYRDTQETDGITVDGFNYDFNFYLE
ncbi:hypothetical protein [Lacinutrix sp. Hel_I_90]|uniref:hypothetical protein n=1 Tax=Lacinutrix sp. Hel_I_90 TaxID=1249999 RepID=UPI0005C954F3|nr:hypothetical protein [Lacinutrix sp. Hel_I_90]